MTADKGTFTPEPTCTDGCHSGPWADFDHYCDTAGIKDGEEGAAFGAWLNASTGWDGEMGQVVEDE